MVNEYFAADDFGISHVKRLESEDNAKARLILENTTRRIGKRFETGLLWKQYPPELPDSYELAVKRLLNIEQKMKRNPTYSKLYCAEMQKYIDKGYAKMINNQELPNTEAPIWYLPHFGVQTPHEPGKLRIVFDAAATVNEVSLNTTLLKGPEQAKPLLGILFKFREGPIAVAADIREMFSQIKIREQDQHAQRFLWRFGKVDQPIQRFVMTSMIFGSICSPCCAEFIKNRNAEDFRTQYPDAVACIINNHYVDDFVSSFKNEESALEICRQVINIQAEAGFELRGFCPIRTQSANNFILQFFQITMYSIWRGNSMFEFHTKFHRIPDDVLRYQRPPTKRELLGIVIAVFDPFGLIADFMIYAKMLIKETWKRGIAWDNIIPDNIARTWYGWWVEFKKIEQMEVARNYSKDLLNCDRVELHIMVDASQDAFTAVGYFRIIKGNKVDVVFVAGKTRGSPKKLMSVPRLELQAAILGVRLYKIVCKNHNITVTKSWFWSDSHTVLCWIKSPERKYKAFVAHRIAEILSISNQSQWRWVPTEHNAADSATRANYPPIFSCSSRWRNGPEFLKLDEGDWPAMPLPTPSTLHEEELCPCHLATNKKPDVFDFSRFSSYTRLKRTVAWVLRAARLFRVNAERQPYNPNIRNDRLNNNEIAEAEKWLCKIIQHETFSNEIAILNKNKRIDKKSPLYSLCAYLDENYLLRINGRFDEALYLPIECRRPIILPKTHAVSMLIVRHYHEKNFHQNHEIVLYTIRQRFWIIGARSLLKSIVHNCVTCKTDRGQPEPQRMGQLPAERITPYIRPFSYTGVDLFGPFDVTIGRRKEKRWAVIFTCLTVRAAHIELAENLSTDAFLVCLRNFINRRGTPVQLRSDNGTNFIGAQRELKVNEQLLNMRRLLDETSQRNIEWIFNCPLNPSSGGCWERLIQVVKRLLHRILKDEAPNLK